VRALSNKPASKDNVHDVLNREVIPFLRELERAVRAIAESGSSTDPDELLLTYLPTGYTRVIAPAVTTALEMLSSHFNGISTQFVDIEGLLTDLDDAVAAAEDAAADAAAAAVAAQAAADDAQDAVDELDSLRCNAVFCWMHINQVSGSSQSRKMYPSYVTAAYPATDTVLAPVILIPADGEIFGFVARHTPAPGPEADTLTYVIYKGAASNPHTMTDTALTIVLAGDSGVLGSSAGVVAVSAGEFIGVRFDCSGAISGMPNASNGGGEWASFMYRRTP
jgi:hypothetical protein